MRRSQWSAAIVAVRPWLVLLCAALARASEASQICSGAYCTPAPAVLQISQLEPAAGPLDGGTQLVVLGLGFRDYASLMRCRFE